MAKNRKLPKSDEYLLIDGYNIIHAWKNLSEIALDNLEEARDKLLDIICNYRGFVKFEIIVVFDAYKVKNNSGSVQKFRNITVVYTKEAETADHYIEKTAKLLTQNYVVKVATSDYLEQIIIMGVGAIRMTPNELLANIEDAKVRGKRKLAERQPAKNNMLIDNLDPETARIFDLMRYGQE